MGNYHCRCFVCAPPATAGSLSLSRMFKCALRWFPLSHMFKCALRCPHTTQPLFKVNMDIHNLLFLWEDQPSTQCVRGDKNEYCYPVTLSAPHPDGEAFTQYQSKCDAASPCIRDVFCTRIPAPLVPGGPNQNTPRLNLPLVVIEYPVNPLTFSAGAPTKTRLD